MSRSFIMLLIDQARARIVRLDLDPPNTRQINAHRPPTSQHGSDARASYGYFSEVCAASDENAEILVVGARQTLSDFSRYVRTYHPQVSARIVGYEIIGDSTEPQLVAYVRHFFEQRWTPEGRRDRREA